MKIPRLIRRIDQFILVNQKGLCFRQPEPAPASCMTAMVSDRLPGHQNADLLRFADFNDHRPDFFPAFPPGGWLRPFPQSLPPRDDLVLDDNGLPDSSFPIALAISQPNSISFISFLSGTFFVKQPEGLKARPEKSLSCGWLCLPSRSLPRTPRRRTHVQGSQPGYQRDGLEVRGHIENRDGFFIRLPWRHLLLLRL
jgi:hypothetical protein